MEQKYRALDMQN